MTCGVCGKAGGYECPVCGWDYCEKHYSERVGSKIGSRESRLPLTPESTYCPLCGSEL